MSHPTLNEGGEYVWRNSVAGKAFVGLDNQFLKVNMAFCRLVGYTEDELKAMTWPEITVEEDIEADRLAVAQVIDGSLPYHEMAKTYVYKGGLKRVPVKLTVIPFNSPDGQCACLFAQVLALEQPIQRVQVVHQDENGNTLDLGRFPALINKYPKITALLILYFLFGREVTADIIQHFLGG